MAHGAGAGPGRQRGDPGDPAAQRRPIGAYTGERVMRPAHHRGGHATRAERGEDSVKEMGGREFLKRAVLPPIAAINDPASTGVSRLGSAHVANPPTASAAATIHSR